MAFEFALVPVLAGYWVLTRTHLLGSPYERRTHHRVFFEPAVVGGGLLLVAWLLELVLGGAFEQDGFLAGVGNLWRGIAPFENAGLLALTATLALALPPAINARVSAVDAANRWALANDSTRGRLLRVSMEDGKLLEVVLAGGEAHVGLVSSSPGFDFEGDLALAPALSGYRDNDTGKLLVKAYYGELDDDFRIVIRLDKVLTVRHFDPRSQDVEWTVSASSQP